MNDVWKRIFKKYIECYEAIDTLNANGIMVDDALNYKTKLLDEIIETFRSEVKE